MTSPSADVVMYSTPWCGYCHRLKGQLRRAGVSFDTVDITFDPESAALVESLNRGNQTVPTLVFSDGSALTNPSVPQVVERIGRLAESA